MNIMNIMVEVGAAWGMAKESPRVVIARYLKVIPHNYQQLSTQQRVYAEYSQNIQIKMDTPAQQQK